jgi:hypothetical protein
MITDRIIDGSNDTITAQMETGLSNVLVNVRRRSDGFYLDWADDTFKASGWTTQNAAMTEVGSTGQYERALLLSNVLNLILDDVYIITVSHVTSRYSPQIGELKAGDWVSNLDAPISDTALETTAQAIKAKTDTIDFAKLLSLLGVNRRILNTVHDANGNLLSAIIRGYANATDAQNNTNYTIELTVTGTALSGFQNTLLEVEL